MILPAIFNYNRQQSPPQLGAHDLDTARLLSRESVRMLCGAVNHAVGIEQLPHV